LFRGSPTQKGFDLIAEKAHELMHEDLLLVVLGSGDRKYEELFRALGRGISRTRWCENRLRQRRRAQNRSRRRHVSHALALRALRLEPDL